MFFVMIRVTSCSSSFMRSRGLLAEPLDPDAPEDASAV